MSDPIDDMQEPFAYEELIDQLLQDLEYVLPVLLDRKLPKAIHEKLQQILLNARDINDAGKDVWLN